ncbi:MAG: hypothetical protein ACLU3I_17045 [Acutalibacteraceae bacterium]
MEQLREQMGLNRPLPVQYVDWLNDVLHCEIWANRSLSTSR